MIERFKPKNNDQATERELDQIAIILNRDWQKAVRTADRSIRAYLVAEIDDGPVNSR